MLLVCSRRCGGKLFRALFAEVDIDSSGAYLDHRIAQAGYICLNCGSPSLDLSEVSAEMHREADEEEAPPAAAVLCPVCDTVLQVDTPMECPNCRAPLEDARGT